MCFLFLQPLCDHSFCELCLSSKTNKRSSFLYPKYSHTANFNLYFDSGIEIRENGLSLMLSPLYVWVEQENS